MLVSTSGNEYLIAKNTKYVPQGLKWGKDGIQPV